MLALGWVLGWIIKAFETGVGIAHIYELLAGLIACLAVFLTAFFIETVRRVAVMRMIVLAPLTYSEAYKIADQKKWLAFIVHLFLTAIWFAIILGWFALAAATIIGFKGANFYFVISTILLALIGLALTFSASWFALLGTLAFAVLSCETLSFSAIWPRTWSLMWPYLWRGGSFVCVVFATVLMLILAGELPVGLIGYVVNELKMAQHVDITHTLPQGGVLVAQAVGHVWEALLATIVTVIQIVSYAYYYWDVRLRLEGNDILAKIDELKSLS